jgi:hypothetical protein
MNTVKPFQHRLVASIAAAAAAFALSACGGGGGGGGQPTPSPTASPTPGQVKLNEPNAVMAALSDKIASGSGQVNFVAGSTPPPPSVETPKIDTGVPGSKSIPADSEATSLPVTVLSGQAMANLFAKVPGANSFFQVPLPSEGGKRLQVPLWKAAGKAETTFVPLQFVDFRLTLPENIETGGEFCFEFTVETGNGEVTQPAQSCINVADAFAQPAPNDQPPAALLPQTLAGTWASECLDIEDVVVESNTIRALVLALEFGADQSYNQFAEVFSDDGCNSGVIGNTVSQNGVFTIPDGEAGATAYSNQVERWQRPVDFNPIDPEEGVDLLPCYNLISLADDGTTLYVGLPVTFIDPRSGTSEGANDCREPANRPKVVLNSLPFSKR